MRRFAREVIDAFGVSCGGEHRSAASLSGGNLQKFIVGREIHAAAAGDDRGAAHLGRRCRRRAADPPEP